VPRTECFACSSTATRFWGTVPVCKRHLAEEQDNEPDAHSCPECGKEQKPQALWTRSKPCSECQSKEDRDA
jgi:hypothetical protein